MTDWMNTSSDLMNMTNQYDGLHIPTNSRCIKDPNRMINHGQREQIT